MEAEWTNGIRSYQVLRGQDDPNRVLVLQTLDSREAAEALVNNPALREAMGRAGVMHLLCRSSTSTRWPPGRADAETPEETRRGSL